jgi:hypothetical protein
MGDKMERVLVELPATAVRFAEACAGGRDISRVIEAGLKSLAGELMKEDAREHPPDSHYVN